MSDTFEWPCERRDAHGPHVETGITKVRDGDGRVVVEAEVIVDECPGVPAHPATMIGGKQA